MKKITLILIIIAFASCKKQAVTDKQAAVAEIHNAKNSLDYVGTYKGILPCADCNGLEVELVINENSTFCIKTKYEGRGDKVFMQKGSFTWNEKGNTIILTDIKNAPNQYFVGEKRLTQLDLSGKKITGSLADEYILSKQPADTSDLEAVEQNSATVDLNSRISSTTTIEKVNPAVGKYTLAETTWKLISLNKKKIVQQGAKPYFIKLNSKEARFDAFTGCNSIFGNYAMPSSSTLSFMEVGATLMACANMTLETKFMNILQATNSYKLDNDKLIFYGNGTVLAEFRALAK